MSLSTQITRYVDLAQGGAFARNNIKSLEEMSKLEFTYPDCYATYFRFGEDFKEYVLKTGSVKGFTGKYTASFLPFDIDNEDLSKAKEQTIKLLTRLQIVYGLFNKDIAVYYSGAKGFHIQIPQEVFGGFEECDNLAYLFRELANELSSGIEIDTSIYEMMRLWRITNTINGKSGLYKISLTFEELFLSIDEIRQLATQPRNIIRTQPELRPNLQNLFEEIKNYKPKIISTQKVFPPNEKYCIYNILNNGVPQGERNNALLRLATYFNQRFPQDIVLGMLRSWNIKTAVNLPDNEVIATVQSSINGYDFGCNDGLLSKYCDEKCTYHLKKKDTHLGIKIIDDLEREYADYINHLDEQKIKLALWLPKFEEVSRGLSAGEVVIVIAGAGVGKTALLQNLLWHVSYPAVFFSYELPEILTFERFYQIANDCSGDQVENDYLYNTIKSQNLKSKFNALSMMFNAEVKVDDIPAIVQFIENKIMKKIRIIAIDYLGLVRGGTGSRYERVSYIAENLKNIAKKTNAVVFCLSQISRQDGAQGDEELILTSGKDSGSIENVGDLVIGLYRPNRNKVGEEDYLMLKILKNRKGRDGIAIACDFDKNTLRISQKDKTYSQPN